MRVVRRGMWIALLASAALIPLHARAWTLTYVNTRYVGVVVAQAPTSSLDGAWWQMQGRTIGGDLPNAKIFLHIWCYDQVGIANQGYGYYQIDKKSNTQLAGSLTGIRYGKEGQRHVPAATTFYGGSGYSRYRGVQYSFHDAVIETKGNHCPNPTTLVRGHIRLTLYS